MKTAALLTLALALAACAGAPPTPDVLVAECVEAEIDRRTGWLANDDGLLTVDSIYAYCRAQFPR